LRLPAEGGRESYGLSARDRPYGFVGREETRVVEREVLGTRAIFESDEHHERRRELAVEAEVVGPARAHWRGEVEASLGK
jgi:hypothetical protein